MIKDEVEDNDEGRLIDIIAYVDGNGQKIVEAPEERKYRSQPDHHAPDGTAYDVYVALSSENPQTSEVRYVQASGADQETAAYTG